MPLEPDYSVYSQATLGMLRSRPSQLSTTSILAPDVERHWQLFLCEIEDCLAARAREQEAVVSKKSKRRWLLPLLATTVFSMTGALAVINRALTPS